MRINLIKPAPLSTFKVIDAYSKADLGTYDARDASQAAGLAWDCFGVHPDDSIVTEVSVSSV